MFVCAIIIKVAISINLTRFEFKNMLRTTDSSSEDEFDSHNIMRTIGNKIRTFIRMKESEVLRTRLVNNSLLKKKPKNCRITYQEETNVYFSASDDSSCDESEKSDLIIKAREIKWERYWVEINSMLKVLKGKFKIDIIYK